MNQSKIQERALRKVRSALAERARRRQSHTFTSDDVHTILNKPEFRDVGRQSILTATFNEGNFYKIGKMVPSAREVARGRKINEWSTYEVMFGI